MTTYFQIRYHKQLERGKNYNGKREQTKGYHGRQCDSREIERERLTLVGTSWKTKLVLVFIYP